MTLKTKKIAAVCGGVVVLGLIVFFSIRATRKEEVTVASARVVRRDVLTSKVSASGEIRAKEFVDIQSEVAGVVTELPVHEGDKVQKGDVLLRIDPVQTEADTNSSRALYDAASSDARSQELQILTAESNLKRDEAGLLSSKASLEEAESAYARNMNSFKRKQQLNEEGLISREDYELAQDQLKSAKSRLDAARARVTQDETQIEVSRNEIARMKETHTSTTARKQSQAALLARSRDVLKKTTLTSPLGGVITQLLVEKGERAVPGIMSNPQATLMTIADLSVIQAELKVDETDVISLALGNHTGVKVDALPDVVFEGEVTEIGNSPIKSSAAASGTTQQQEAKDFKVIVTLKSPSPKLRPGMSCTGDIVTDKKQNVLVLPIQALTMRDVAIDKDGKYHEPDLKKKEKPGAVAQADSSRERPKKKELQGVFVINKDKLARFRPVKTGITGEAEIEVLDSLQEGEEVVSGSFQTLRTIKDGARVKVDNTTKSPSEKKT
ncbi:MAG: secretion protein HlyD [Acidobacteria bacterium]|nr:MAG: secretion protein HlyD [Acidobacteriota bacterium]